MAANRGTMTGTDEGALTVPVHKLDARAKLPHRATRLAAGWDLYSIDAVELAPGARALVGTGLAVALPAGWEMQIRPRSGLAHKHGVTVLNAPGTVDADYRGEVKVLLVNLGDASVELPPGSRIAQAVVARHARVDYRDVDALPPTERGEGGFGHTGVSTRPAPDREAQCRAMPEHHDE